MRFQKSAISYHTEKSQPGSSREIIDPHKNRDQTHACSISVPTKYSDSLIISWILEIIAWLRVLPDSGGPMGFKVTEKEISSMTKP